MREVIETDSHVVISALAGDAAAGGVPFALAADHVVAREDVVLNPYYQHMGGLYGSEYWTYLMPRRIGQELTAELTSAPFRAIGTRRRGRDRAARRGVRRGRGELPGPGARPRRAPGAPSATTPRWLEEKRRRRARDEQVKPLGVYRTEELARSYECFFGPDRSYHEARSRFVHKLGAPCAVAPPAEAAMTLLQAAVGRRAAVGS